MIFLETGKTDPAVEPVSKLLKCGRGIEYFNDQD